VVTDSRTIDPGSPGTWPKAARLRRRSEFLAVQDRGRRWSGAHLSVWVVPGASPIARIGLTVSRRVGGSVVRTRVKRWGGLPVIDAVCVARPSAAGAGWPAIARDVAAFSAWAGRGVGA
jgi:ribonuclease P protein component